MSLKSLGTTAVLDIIFLNNFNKYFYYIMRTRLLVELSTIIIIDLTQSQSPDLQNGSFF